MIYCILSIILLVIIYDVLAINKIHKRSSLHDPRKKDFVQDIKEYDMNDAASIFNDYNLKYSIRYQNDAEKAKVFNVFRDNLRKINYLNQMTKTAAFSINEFTSMSLEEFTTKYTGYNSANAKVDSYMTRFEYDPKFVYSKNRDFREGGLLIVKHQKECSNSYVHCAVGKRLFVTVILYENKRSYLFILLATSEPLCDYCILLGTSLLITFQILPRNWATLRILLYFSVFTTFVLRNRMSYNKA